MAGTPVTKEFTLEHGFLLLPVKNGGARRHVNVIVDGQPPIPLEVELAQDEPDWWGTLDLSPSVGKAARIEFQVLPGETQPKAAFQQADQPWKPKHVYHETDRPAFHFTSPTGAINDPNGLIYLDGAYHMFYQLNPLGMIGSNKSWGHATSRDLVHWENLPPALYPDPFGQIYSGSAVLDARNTSGLGKEDSPAVVLIYTAAGKPLTQQNLAYSLDGAKTFVKYEGNPVVPQIRGGNRDPRVIWYEPGKHWVMALFIGMPPQPGAAPGQEKTIHFLTSPDLKTWKDASTLPGYYECPDIISLPLNGDAQNIRWVATQGDGRYQVGTFDGETFRPETPILPSHETDGYYASQTFNNLPATESRCLQIQWLRGPRNPKDSFSQMMSVPLSLSLRATPEGPRLSSLPVKEIDVLRGAPSLSLTTAALGTANPLAAVSGPYDIELDVVPEGAGVTLAIGPTQFHYDPAKQEMSCITKAKTVTARLPLENGHLKCRVLVDQGSIELFARDGLSVWPCRSYLPASRGFSLTGEGQIASLTAYPMRSMWGEAPPAPTKGRR